MARKDDGMTPLDLFLEALEKPKYWQERGALRRPIDDPQICGNGYCIAGVLCDLFIKHAPEAKDIKARWEGSKFKWTDGEGEHEEYVQIPPPVRAWWSRYHPHIDIVNQQGIYGNDQRGISFDAFAMFLRALNQQIDQLRRPFTLTDSVGKKHVVA
jgi:hypothetical protein